MAEPGRLLAQVGANGRLAVGRAVPFVEQEVQHLVHAVESPGEFFSLRFTFLKSFFGSIFWRFQLQLHQALF